MLTIIFESHGTSFDNENHLSSGHFDVELSPLGQKQAKELGERYKRSLPSPNGEVKDDHFDAIFCSDLQRSYRTGEIAFGKRFKIIRDKRLRECDYGGLTRHSSEEVEPAKAEHIKRPFPDGESYEDTSKRLRDFLKDLLKKYDGKKVMIVGHAATRYGLEHLINKIPLKKIVTEPFKWQPGWTYFLTSI